jgi:hypothetical protein
MDDERVNRRAVLCLKNFGDGSVVCRVGAEAVDRFGRESD